MVTNSAHIIIPWLKQLKLKQHLLLFHNNNYFSLHRKDYFVGPLSWFKASCVQYISEFSWQENYYMKRIRWFMIVVTYNMLQILLFLSKGPLNQIFVIAKTLIACEIRFTLLMMLSLSSFTNFCPSFCLNLSGCHLRISAFIFLFTESSVIFSNIMWMICWSERPSKGISCVLTSCIELNSLEHICLCLQ